MELEAAAAIYGAILSTGLVVWEFYKNKARFDVEYYFSDEPYSTDKIAFYNKSNKPVVISHVQIIKNYNEESEREYDIGFFTEFILISINPNSFYKLEIEEQYKFKVYNDSKISIKLKVLGKNRPVIIPIKLK
ncbi:hypothetical protein [Chryseobacterium sp. 18068]|uniref:hypothetical protein n=1 Tax=Chryseobacterium sp. 18068 TaxID=2681414 RepID=UPI00135B2764|nr:hypothetical protein [Chryseobacterium sp. 18068]